ncbi:MAG: carboxylate-amine ligase [bacterium]|nr:carboxylate-amine ligase [bacterium]
MRTSEPSFSIGMEEEYHLVEIDTGDLVIQQPDELLATCTKALGDRVTREFQQCQIEIGTKVCANAGEIRSELRELRAGIADITRQHGIAPIAVSTHPYGEWDKQVHTRRERYDLLERDMQIAARRLLICGMHVHVGIEDEALRIDLFNQASYFLPHLLALTASSPFWKGGMTGLKAYRLSVFDELPRTGLPEPFSSWGEYRRMVNLLVEAKIISDATMIWWDLRPSEKFPTLEMRICDVCPRIDDAVAVAMLYRCILRMLYRLRHNNQRWRAYPTFLIRENRWRAQRYGVSGTMIDFGRGEMLPFHELIDELIEHVMEDAQVLDCVDEVNHCKTIAREGTSADRQIALFKKLAAEGASDKEALRAIVQALRAETLEGTSFE